MTFVGIVNVLDSPVKSSRAQASKLKIWAQCSGVWLDRCRDCLWFSKLSNFWFIYHVIFHPFKCKTLATSKFSFWRLPLIFFEFTNLRNTFVKKLRCSVRLNLVWLFILKQFWKRELVCFESLKSIYWFLRFKIIFRQYF